ncbi:Long-chain fatty acid transport protein [Zhouia amylolytica]|uniref:Outer membrane protein n=2 Tax=Zhouia amylolytica TaxID=376730 RepID=W2UKJ2_9FLAO|nr:hypothetical protein [Zhouia amylolytica]ETN93827.1 hypothetical protein P278_32370 [Zhouia amylolytica AD3]MCQ0111727.1 hypothetical protein [Zhouia amylolytica]SFS34538.1 Long-chain fatty acid transport protein [Zhouia amylolytica]
MIKRIFVAFALMMVGVGFAQTNGSPSPYSYFGVGQSKYNNTAESRAMGGLSVYSDSIHVNLANPASFSKLRLTTYSAGLSYNSLGLKTDDANENASTVSFDYLALGVPVSDRFGFGFGIQPYSTVGYRLQSIEEDADGPAVLNRYSGDGGVNKVFFSMGYRLYKGLSVGLTGSYLFGKTEHKYLGLRDDIRYGTREISASEYSGFDVKAALNYEGKLGKKLYWQSSFMYTPESILVSENSREVATVLIGSNGEETPRDTQDVDLSEQGLDRINLSIPQSFTAGLGVGESKKWYLGAEFELKKTSKFENKFENFGRSSYENAERFSVGGFFIPDYDSFTSYWKRIVYRAGLHNGRSGLKVNGMPTHDFGMTFGVGMPLGGYVPSTNALPQFTGMFSNINIGVEIGKRGSTLYNRVQENYFNVNIGLSFNDRWFVKRKYD